MCFLITHIVPITYSVLCPFYAKFRLDDYLLVVESSDTKAQSSHVLPDRLLKKANVHDTHGRGFQDRTRSMIYSLLVLSTAAVVGLKWMVILC